jgi:hypothetical protein
MSFLTKKIYTIRMKLKKKLTNRGPLNIVYYVCFHYRFKQCNDNFDLLKKYKKKKLTIGVKSSFPRDSLGIIRLIADKLVYTLFLQ